MSDEKMYEIVNDPKKLKKYKPFKVYSIVDDRYVIAKSPHEDFDHHVLNHAYPDVAHSAFF